MRRHWSERYGCSCGFTTTSYAADAKHRHNFPALCRRPREKKGKRHGGQALQAEKVRAAEAPREDA